MAKFIKVRTFLLASQCNLLIFVATVICLDIVVSPYFYCFYIPLHSFDDSSLLTRPFAGVPESSVRKSVADANNCEVFVSDFVALLQCSSLCQTEVSETWWEVATISHAAFSRRGELQEKSSIDIYAAVLPCVRGTRFVFVSPLQVRSSGQMVCGWRENDISPFHNQGNLLEGLRILLYDITSTSTSPVSLPHELRILIVVLHLRRMAIGSEHNPRPVQVAKDLEAMLIMPRIKCYEGPQLGSNRQKVRA